MSATRLDSRSGAGSWISTGVLMGLVAGVVFIVFELIIAGITGNLFGPLRLISAIVMGKSALPPPPVAPLATAIIVGLIVHFVLSAIWGFIFGVIAWIGRSILSSRIALIVAATVFGFLLWIVNFYVIAIGIGLFPWFSMPNPVVQFLAHTFFFGTALGLFLAARVGQREGRVATE